MSEIEGAVARAIYAKFEDRPVCAQAQMNGILAEELARAAIEAYEAAKRVEPIETAPRDGTPILAVYGDGYGMRAYSVRAWSRGDWSTASEGWADEYRQLRVEQPTHWMKLPNLDEVKP